MGKTKITNKQQLTYNGNVVTYIELPNKKRVKIAESHNTGGADLFHFFSECLAGNYSTAAELRPTKIKLLYAETNTTTYEDRSDFCAVDEGVKVSSDDNGYYATFHFKVPYALIKPVQEQTKNKVNHFGLYKTAETNNDKYCALYNLGTDTISLVDLGKNYSIIIEWTLQVTNQATQTPTVTTATARRKTAIKTTEVK